MTFGALLATGLVAVLAVMVAVVVFVPRLRIIAAYTISLPACVLASLLVFGFIRLDWWPAWSSRPLMYLSAPLAAVTVLMLLVTGMFRIFGGPLNWRYVLNATYGLTAFAACACMALSAVFDQWGAVLWHLLGGACGVLVVAVVRSKLLPRSDDPFNR